MPTYWEMTTYIIRSDWKKATSTHRYWKPILRIMIVFMSFIFIPAVIDMIYRKLRYGVDP